MTTAFERLNTGYYNSDPVSVSNPGGFDDDGHQVNFPAALGDVAEVAEMTGASAAAAQASASTALLAPGTSATQTTPLTIAANTTQAMVAVAQGIAAAAAVVPPAP